MTCDECGLSIYVDDALAPSCGSHRLHDACMAWFFGCNECDQVQQEACT